VKYILFANLVAAPFMVGIVWFVQVEVLEARVEELERLLETREEAGAKP
jgi:hypothetical protein